MKLKGIRLTRYIDNLVAKYGSINDIPESQLTDLQKDFKSDHDPIRHRYFDEDELPWNRMLYTYRLKVFIVAKSLRIRNKQKRLQFIHKYGISHGIAYNIVYQHHLHHRGYTYQYKNKPKMRVSYRKEILDAINIMGVPGPRSETGLADVMDDHGLYRPTGHVVGRIQKITIIRGVTYRPRHNKDKSKVKVVHGTSIIDPMH